MISTKHHTRRVSAAALVLLVFTSSALAQRESIIVDTSIQTVRELVRDPIRGVPSDVLRRAQGVIVIPNMLQAGFVFGARIGRGIVMMRNQDGEWSNPFFIRMTGGSFGLQAGANSNEMMLVFQDRRTIDRFLMGRNKMTFGVDASYAVGPTGEGVGANTDPALQADIFVYSRARGLFAGAAINGAIARVDTRANWSYYNHDASASDIVQNVDGLQVPDAVARLKAELTTDADVETDPDKPASEKPGARPARPRSDDPIIEPIPGFEPDKPGVKSQRQR